MRLCRSDGRSESARPSESESSQSRSDGRSAMPTTQAQLDIILVSASSTTGRATARRTTRLNPRRSAGRSSSKQALRPPRARRSASTTTGSPTGAATAAPSREARRRSPRPKSPTGKWLVARSPPQTATNDRPAHRSHHTLNITRISEI